MTSSSNILRSCLVTVILIASVVGMSAQTPPKRRVTPLETPATVTQSINEARNDTARIMQARIARSTHFHDEQGRTVYVDTVTGEQWMDSTALLPVVRMKYPLWDAASVSVDIWDPLMRAFGQDYGLIGFGAEVSLHNRYKPVFELGLGMADHKPSGNNYTYKSPMSLFMRIGMNYNFLYNSSPDYQFYGGLRYGFSSFRYSIANITVDVPYWDEAAKFGIPSQTSTVGWMEFVLGLRVKLWGPISAGWAFKYHSILHESKTAYGKPWYIPGYGSRSASVTGSFSVTYTFSLSKLNKGGAGEVISSDEQSSAAPSQESEESVE